MYKDEQCLVRPVEEVDVDQKKAIIDSDYHSKTSDFRGVGELLYNTVPCWSNLPT